MLRTHQFIVIYNFIMQEYQVWECLVCGFIDDEAKGWPADGIVAGTRWSEVPDDWICPDCGVGKAGFQMVLREPNQSNEKPQPLDKVVIDRELQEVANDQLAAQWQCSNCGFIYNVSAGWYEDGIAAGTAFDSIAGTWNCPDCGADKSDFINCTNVCITELQQTPIVIIGTGLAGYGLARELRKIHNSVPIVMLTQDDGAYYSKPQISNAYAQQVSAEDLVIKTAEQMATELKLDFKIYTTVSAIDIE